MKVVIFMLILLFTTIAIIYILSPAWNEFIERTKGKVFRIVREGNSYYVEKRFLWIFFIRLHEYGKNSRKDCLDYIQYLIRKHEVEKEIIDFSNQVSDPKKLIEAKKLETKRIKQI